MRHILSDRPHEGPPSLQRACLRGSAVAALLALVVGPVVARGQASEATTLKPGVELAERASPGFYYTPDSPRSTAARSDASNAAVLGHRLAISLQDATVPAALAAIEQATGIQFVYSAETLPTEHQVTLEASNITVRAALTEVLAGTKLDVEIAPDGHLGLVPTSPPPPPPLAKSRQQQQTRDIHGKVLDGESGQGVASAQIQVKGTTIGALSLGDGTFTIAGVPAGVQTLIVRRIGFKQVEQPIGATEATVQVTLEHDVLHLEETVVTGQATVVKKENVANDVAVVSADQLNQVQAQTIDMSLDGKVAGANIQSNNGAPGGGMQIQLRGASSIIGTSDPLYVVDGVVVSNATIQPGLNIITQAAGTSTIASDEDNGTNRIADLDPNDIQSIEILKGASAAAIYGSKAANGVVVITTKQGQVGKPQIRLTQKFGVAHISNEVGTRRFSSDSSVLDAFGSNGLAAYSPGQPIYNHENEVFGQTPFNYVTNGSISGGSENTQYFVSGINEHDGGLAPNTYYNKKSANAKLTETLSKQLQLQFGLTLLSTGDGRGLTQNDNVGASEYASLPSVPNFFNLLPNAAGVYPVNPFGTSNPVQTANLFRNEESINRGIGSASGTWHILSTGGNALNLVANGGADYFQEQNNVYSPPTLQYEIAYGNPGTTVLTMSNNLQTNINVDLVDLVTPASGAFTSTTSLGVQQYTTYLNTDQTAGKNLTGDLQNVNTGTIVDVFQNRQIVNDAGFFAQEEFLTLHDRLMLTAGIRGDRSSDNADIYKVFYYPKASASYRVPGSWAFINGLKLRAAFGESGNEPLYGQKFGELNPDNYSGIPASQLAGSVSSPDLQPERQIEAEGGFDLTLFDSAMTLGVTGYQKTISDLLLERSLATSTGYNTEFFNGGGMRSRGIEIELTAAPIQHRSLQWTINTTFAKVDEVITSLPVPPFEPANVGFGLEFGTAFIQNGVSPTETVGNCPEAGGAVGICNLGDTNPDYRIGFSNDLVFGRFHLFFTLDGQHQSVQDDVTELSYDFSANTSDFAKMVDCKSTGTEMYLGQCRVAQFPTNLHVYISSASFIKLRELQLAYNLPTRWLRPLGPSFTSAALQVEGRNLLVVTHYQGLDPEASNFGNQNVGRNIDLSEYPPSRQIWFGVNLGL